MKRIKKFYTTVGVNTSQKSSTFQLLLDGKQVRTPLGEPLLLPNEAVAAAVATEWQLQSKFVVPNSMPISTVLMTNIDIDSKMGRTEHITQISRYFQTDTVRFPDLDKSSALALQQKKHWKPILDYLNSVGVILSQSKAPFALPDSTEAEVKAMNETFLRSYDSLQLTMLETLAKYLKSGSIAVGVLEGILSPEAAFKAAFVEEICQREEWGLVEGDHDMNDAETKLWINGVSLLATALRIVRP
jgi:ATP synthase F1 complex assembly factor 2